MPHATGEEILRVFRNARGKYISGEALSRTLGVTRTAVWKQIGILRQAGYVIEAIPSRGYCLKGSPDALIPSAIRSDLGTKRIGSKVICLDETDSTNLRAREQGDEGAPDGTVVIADSQTAGKGRMGRQWVSPPGVNLYSSVLLRPPILPFDAPQLTFLSAVAVARAVEEGAVLEPKLKWPNDILVNGMKVAGLLNEMDAETESVRYVILGIGVNINMETHQFPEGMHYPATSLAIEKGERISRLLFVRSFLRHLDDLYEEYLREGFEPVRRAWIAYCDLAGREIEVDFHQKKLRGICRGIDEDGALLLETPQGIERVLAGDVRPL